MTLRKRIILILCGVAVFVVAAPTIILLARGYFFDFKEFRLIGTGILTVKSSPKGAEIFLDGKKTKATPAVLRLLLPKEYRLELIKTGYRDWHKNVTVHGHLVTSIPSDPEKEVALLQKSSVQTNISTTTSDFQETPQGIFFAEEGGIFQLDVLSGKKTWAATTTLSQILKNIPANAPGNFRLSENAFWQNDRILVPNLPSFKKGEIIATPDNQIFLLLDSDLYQVAEKLAKINGGVAYVFWDSEADVLIYGNGHEIWMFQPSGKNELVTRSSKTLGRPAYHEKINYIFASEGREIKAIEADSSGQPNIYSLIETANDNIKIAINPDGTHLLYLDGENLYTLKIR